MAIDWSSSAPANSPFTAPDPEKLSDCARSASTFTEVAPDASMASRCVSIEAAATLTAPATSSDSRLRKCTVIRGGRGVPWARKRHHGRSSMASIDSRPSAERTRMRAVARGEDSIVTDSRSPCTRTSSA